MWAHVRERRGAYRVLDRKPVGKRQFGRYRFNKRIVLKRVFQETGWERGVDWSDIRLGHMVGCFERGNEHSRPIK